MARDRQRAKRRQRRAQNPGPAASKPHRDNVPGELDHISGQVEEFEAAIVAGGEGVASDEPIEAEADADADARLDAEPEELHDADEAIDEEELGVAAVDEAAPAARPAKRSGNSVINFLRASWAELQRVQWPDRRQVGQATAVVLGFVVIAGAYLGLADALAQELVNFIL